MRVVLDTNIIVSGSISAHGVPGQILSAWEQGVFVLLVSPVLLVEYRRTLGYERVRTYHPMDNQQLDEHVRSYATFGILAEPEETASAITDDPDDNRILERAEASATTHIMSGDTHLLKLAM